MSSITKVLFYPVVSLRRRFGRRPKASVDNCPPPTEEEKQCKFGSYCVKATVEATGKNGVVDRTFIGYSQNMNITMKTQVACDRYKLPGTECSEATLVIKGGECDEVIMMKTRDGRIMNLSTPG